MKLPLLLLLSFASFLVSSMDPKSYRFDEQTRANFRQRLQHLFDRPDSCNTKNDKDIRVVLLGQAWIRFGDSDLNYEGVKEMIDFLHTLDATVLFSNLETAINGSYAIENGAEIINPINTHVSPPAVIDILQKNYTSNVISTANNHNSDIGPNGTISAILEFQARGLQWTGSGYNAEQAIKPTYVTTKKKLVIGVMGVVSSPLLSVYGGIADETTPGVNTMQLINNETVPDPVARANNLAEINKACKKADLLVQYHHNHFFNETYNIDEWWQTFAHDTMKNGAGLYLAQGAQNIRGIELYMGNPIIYGNGNLMFQTDRVETPMNKEGYFVDLCYDGRSTVLKSARIIPTVLTNGTNYQNKGLPTIAQAEQALGTLNRLKDLSAILGTNIIIDSSNYIATIDLTNNVITPPPKSLKCKRNKDLKDHAFNDEWENEEDGNWDN